MKPPKGYEQYSNDRRLLPCLFLKALYGLKQKGSGTSSSVNDEGDCPQKVHSEPCIYVWKENNWREDRCSNLLWVTAISFIGGTTEGI